MVAMAVSAISALSACSSGLNMDEYAACTGINEWIIGGRDPAFFEQFASQTVASLSDSEHEDLVVAAGALVNSHAENRANSATDFMEICKDLGWEPPEG